MNYLNGKTAMVILAIGGMLACFLPWIRISQSAIPPGDVADVIFTGYQHNGQYCAICFLVIGLVCLLTSLTKPIDRRVAYMTLGLSIVALAIPTIDILRIVLLPDGMTGSVPYLGTGPFVTAGIASIIFVIASFAVVKTSQNESAG